MMAGRGGGQPAADGGLARHIPVLGRPAVEFLNVRDGGVYIDATFGAGGYTRAILDAAAWNWALLCGCQAADDGTTPPPHI